MKFLVMVLLLVLLVWGMVPWLPRILPPGWNPFTPLAVNDPPTLLTRYKLTRLSSDNAACQAVLRQAAVMGVLRYRTARVAGGECPLENLVRVESFGAVSLNSAFLASCPLAVSSTMYILQQAAPLAERMLSSALVRIEHVGSFACRNVYHRAEGRRSEHATADAWDVTGFRLANGQHISVEKHWQSSQSRSAWLQHIFAVSCPYFGHSLGPDYNAAHATHFHFGRRGIGFCR